MKDVVEFTHIVRQTNAAPDNLQEMVSPDGQQAFLVTRKADVRTDRNLYDILLLDLRPDRLAQGKARPPQLMLRVEASKDNDNSSPFVQDARWTDDRTIVFRGRLSDAPYQVYRLDVPSRRLVQLTYATHGITSFVLSRDLSRVVYATPVPNPPMADHARSVVVANKSFWSVKFGQDDMRSQQRTYQFVVADSGSRRPGRRLGPVIDEVGGARVPPISVSPDGRWALIPRNEPNHQIAWASQYPLVNEMSSRYGPGIRQDPLRYYTIPRQWVARLHVAYRLSDGREQTVLDAPDDSTPAAPTRPDRIWRRDGKSVVIAGTHLPAADSGMAPSSASHIIEYWPDTGRWSTIAVLRSRLEAALPLEDKQDGFVAIDGDKRRTFLRRADRGWQEVDLAEKSEAPKGSGWSIRVDQAVDRPADVVADGPQGQVVRLTSLNPQFKAESWGTMRPYSWSDSQGRPWDGGLMFPAGHDPSRKYPLVIQTYGFSPKRFYLDGSNVSGGATSGFAGRAFLREDMLVLALPVRASKDAPRGGREEIVAFADGVRSAIEALASQGVIDRDRVGIIGWSATGERALNLLTFDRTPIRAASLLDGDANTLFGLTVTYGFNDGAEARVEQDNQGAPFGDTLNNWVRNDPALHTDCIRAAVRIETYGPWVLANWDIHALLRRQYKPAEMIVIPDGNHALARPSERMISLQGNVDWYRFWLKGEERVETVLLTETKSDLRQQYLRWREMLDMKRVHDAKPRCQTQAVGG